MSDVSAELIAAAKESLSEAAYRDEEPSLRLMLALQDLGVEVPFDAWRWHGAQMQQTADSAECCKSEAVGVARDD